MPLRTPSCCFIHNPLHPILTLRRRNSTLRNKPFFITTPIFYPNAAPHIGHLYSLVVADIFARHARLTRPSEPAILLSGTDEHGLKIQKAAKDEGLHPKSFVQTRSKPFRDLAAAANVSLTHFVRTSLQPHHKAVSYLWNGLFDRGLIYKGKHAGWYSMSDECFYTDKQVIDGQDPKTKQKAKIAKETGNVVVHAEEKNYMFKLSSFRDRLMDRYTKDPDIIYPPQQHQDVLNILSAPDGLQDLSVSRPASRLSWGVKVPNDPEQTIYVWVDALTSYLSGVGYPWTSEDDPNPRWWAEGVAWPPDIQVIGKDILRFHAIYFPAFLMALDLPLPRTLLSHSHWTVNKTKMSKSLGNVIDPMKEMESYGTDVIRWYLARVGCKFKDDVDWSTEQLEKHESEARSLLGNFLLRIQSRALTRRLPLAYQDVPLEPSILFPQHSVSSDPRSENWHPSTLQDTLTSLSSVVDSHLTAFDPAAALDAIISALNLANKLISDTTPWSKTTCPDSTAVSVITWSRETLRICGILLQPFIPGKAGELLDALSVGAKERTWAHAEVGRGEVRPGPVGRVMLFPNREQRNMISVDKDHEAEEKGEVVLPGSAKPKAYWQKVQ